MAGTGDVRNRAGSCRRRICPEEEESGLTSCWSENNARDQAQQPVNRLESIRRFDSFRKQADRFASGVNHKSDKKIQSIRSI